MNKPSRSSRIQNISDSESAFATLFTSPSSSRKSPASDEPASVGSLCVHSCISIEMGVKLMDALQPQSPRLLQLLQLPVLLKKSPAVML